MLCTVFVVGLMILLNYNVKILKNITLYFQTLHVCVYNIYVYTFIESENC